jgi:flagellar biosynthesis protein FlhG
MNIIPKIVPIASGKGGVGKTFLAANLAIALAEAGHPTIVVDMDLGGSNLHSFLGLANRFPGIGDFLKVRSAELEELLVDTVTPNLRFIPGDGVSPFLANIPYAQKIRLISRVKKLPAEYILLDLGAGTSFNTIDFFRISRHGLIVTRPEYPSIMNMLGFLKHFVLRLIERSFSNDQRIRDFLRSLYKQPITAQRNIIENLASKIAAIDQDAGKTMVALCRDFRPRVIFNMGEHPDEIEIAHKIDRSLENALSLEVDYFGFIFEDPHVRQSIKKQTPFLPEYRESIAAKGITLTAKRIANFLEVPVKESAALLLKRTRQDYGKL